MSVRAAWGLACLLALATSAVAEPDDANPRLVVVGRLVDIKQLHDIDCDGCISFDQQFVVTYEVLQVQRGSAPGPRVVFGASDHGSFPDFAETRTALVFLHAHGDKWVLDRYQAIAVDATTEGRWAICRAESDADALDAMANGSAPRLPGPVPIRFADGVVFDDVSRWGADEIARKYPAPTYEVHDGRVTCTRGTYVEDYVEAMEAWKRHNK